MKLWEPKRRIEEMFRRNLRRVAREILRQMVDSIDLDTMQRVLLQLPSRE